MKRGLAQPERNPKCGGRHTAPSLGTTSKQLRPDRLDYATQRVAEMLTGFESFLNACVPGTPV